MSKLAPSSNNMEFFQTLIPGKSQYIAFTNTAEYSADLDPKVTLLRVFSTQDCWIRIVPNDSTDEASAPSETTKTDSFPIFGGIVDFVGVPDLPETTFKVSVVRQSVSGNLFITEGKV